jgi:hypothetical protein
MRFLAAAAEEEAKEEAEKKTADLKAKRVPARGVFGNRTLQQSVTHKNYPAP